VNNAELSGNYAFTFRGSSSNGSVSSVYAAVGRFTADGAGSLANGELGHQHRRWRRGRANVHWDLFDWCGPSWCDDLNIGGSSARLAFAMMADGNAQFIKFDASGGVGTIGSGTMEKADTTAYSTARITGDYAFGAAGFDNVNIARRSKADLLRAEQVLSLT